MNKIYKISLAALIIIISLFLVAFGRRPAPTPPIADKIPKADTLFGIVRVDNYYWLRDRNDPKVLEYLKAENKYTDAMMKPAESLKKKLYKEMVSRIKETDLSVPVKWGDYFYYSRTEKGKQYRIYCRKKGNLKAKEEILLDVNELAKGKDFYQLGVYKVSPNHKLLAFAFDTTGGERYTLRIKDLDNGTLYPDIIDSVSTSFEWANDNNTFFYTTTDSAWRPYRLYKHRLGDSVSNDLLVYQENDPTFSLDIGKSKSEAYLFLELGSETSSEVYFLNADNPDGKFKMIYPRQKDMEYYPYHHGDYFYIVTNDSAKNFKLMKAPISNPSKKNWEVVIPNRKDVKLDGVDLFKDYMVIYEREGGLKQMRIEKFATGEIRKVDFPEPVYTFWAGENPEYDTKTLRFNYTSLITPRSVYDYDMLTGERKLLKQQEVLGGYDPKQYRSEKLFAVASDSTLIPISMVYKKGVVRNGNTPLYLTGYGAYGISFDPYFSSSRLSLLDRGFIYAIAHIRGGGEMGRYWYDDGKLLKKKNTFTDFIAVAEYLINQRYTSPQKLVISGGSAGGLLIGAVVDMRPDLFKAAVLDVPFVDVLNTMLDPSIPLTVGEYDEWGNPHKKKYFDYIFSYSPYDNIKAQNYPNMLIFAGLNDTRVQYWEPAKFTAKLRALKTDDNLLLLKVNMEAGHGGASGRYDFLKEIAFEYAFILKVLGINN